ncbi:hypothetical protein VOLCADRAFT_88467 [Volvox carteri f. nagariensis]|uniref:CHK kinase-like domain-containing protein n=1 Tax=Volvox carteri f. nagariensis TaxID=3068 RepID=D8TP28_VOLCA|nr:uncharacterized protein VOLCADRAFT_88467 [Volvox carteri f. nagariensis]EFJ50549.1 hypothetical protein VOLCADRAFT_88467 [Volvox carteri f. nagariensis]|eukprot:XP_002948142.1 hypothetical protein VOLCADRAFT_88467 [Volvox carteri f. nagariensis]
MPLPVQIDWTTQLQPHFQAPIASVKSRAIGSLWAGYGSVNSLQVQLKGQSSAVSLIVKDVRPPRGSGVSHERKMASYRVEEFFYKHVGPGLVSSTGLGIPRSLAIESSQSGFQFILTDLRAEYPHPAPDSLDGNQPASFLHERLMRTLQPPPRKITWHLAGSTLAFGHAPRPGFPHRYCHASYRYPSRLPTNPNRYTNHRKQVRAVLSWLATYHAYFWEQPTPAGLQQEGSYWYLDTRREEFERIGPSWGALKAVAEQVAEQLKSPGSSEFKTCIHGDMKNENLLFTKDGARCAAYDFQYTGRSYGVRDVVYLFASSVDSSNLDATEDEYLSYYHSELLDRLILKGEPGIEAACRYRPEVMRRHFDLSLLDYVRFMAGWGMWGSGVDWAVRRARALLPHVGQLLQ